MTSPFDPVDQDRLGETLRRALEREAGQVSPSPDGLRRIRDTIAAQDAARRLSRRGRLQRWRPVLVAAGAAAVLAAGVGAQPLLQTLQGESTAGPAAPSTAAPTDPVTAPPTVSSSEDPAAPTGSSSASPSGPARSTTAAPALPVYVVGPQGGTFGLFREFRPSTRSEPAERVQEAVDAALSDQPEHPDRVRVWASRSAARTSVTETAIIVDLNQSATGTDLATAQGKVSGETLVQQLVWTATAALASSGNPPDGAATIPVRITVDGATVELFGVDLSQPLQRRSLGEPRAGVWITNPAEGAVLPAGTVRISGEAVSRPDNPPTWLLRGTDGGTTDELKLTERPDGSGGPVEPGRRGYWTLELDLQTAGTYTLEVSVLDPQASNPGTVWSDRLRFEVREG